LSSDRDVSNPSHSFCKFIVYRHDDRLSSRRSPGDVYRRVSNDTDQK